MGRSHGLAGLVFVHPRDEAALAALAASDEVWVDGLGAAQVLELKAHGKGWLLRIDRVRRVELAKSLVHAAVRIDPRALPAGTAGPAPDLRGLPVLVDGRPYGTVLERVEGPQPLLRIDGPTGEVLVPASAPYVAVDADAVRVRDAPAGLLDEA